MYLKRVKKSFNYTKKKVTRKHGMIGLKLDMSKAYDRIEWTFMQRALSSMGFPLKFMNMVMKCIQIVSFSIMLNGVLGREFKPHGGSEQGDPLSPYLFILCAETLSILISQIIQARNLHGLNIFPRAHTISHILFANDNIVFGRPIVEEAKEISFILNR